MEETPILEITDTPNPEMKRWRVVPLYKRGVNEQLLFWQADFDGEKINVHHGLSGGKLQTDSQEVIPKVNRTLIEQAHLEIRSLIRRKMDGGYGTSAENLPDSLMKKSGAMLAKQYEKERKKVKFPCYLNPKFDGIRGLARMTPEGLRLFSKMGKLLTYHEHILEELVYLRRYLPSSCIIDGEIYNHHLKFNEIVSRVKNVLEKHSGNEELKYVVYDIIEPGDNVMEKRYQMLSKAFKMAEEEKKFVHIFLSPYILINSHEDIEKAVNYYVNDLKFEGVMIRKIASSSGEKNSKYVRARTGNLLKYKPFMNDEEFKVVGATTGTGREEGAVIWICATKNGGEFKVRPEGTIEDRRTLYSDRDKYINKALLTVKFQGVNPDTGIPRFPVGKSIRDYE